MGTVRKTSGKSPPKAAKARPANKDALVRMWELLKHIPQKPPGRTAAELRKTLEDAGFPVVQRTIERNLSALSKVFPLTGDESREGERWYWMPDRDSGLPGVALSEAIALLLVEKSLTGLIHKSQMEPLAVRLEAARRLVAGSHRANPGAGWVDKVVSLPRDLSHQPPEVKSDISATVQQALLTDRQLEIDYKSFNTVASRRRRLNPHALLLKAPVTYLIATEEPRGEDPAPTVKQYALHRMRSAHILATATRHGSFNLKQYVESQRHEIGSNEPIDLKLVIHSRSLQTILQEVPLAKGQRISTDGGGRFIVDVRVRHTRALERWIHARGAEATVLEPEHLSGKIRAELVDAISKYSL